MKMKNKKYDYINNIKNSPYQAQQQINSNNNSIKNNLNPQNLIYINNKFSLNNSNNNNYYNNNFLSKSNK